MWYEQVPSGIDVAPAAALGLAVPSLAILSRIATRAGWDITFPTVLVQSSARLLADDGARPEERLVAI
jgi:hypothetical protein